MKDLIIQKYGGSSVSDIEKIKNVAKKIIQTKQEGKDVIVVVSAMGDTTDSLTEMAYAISERPKEREMDILLSTGEQISIALLAIAIHSMGYDVISLTGPQCGIVTSDRYNKARIDEIHTKRIRKELEQGKIVIVAGFQGINHKMDITTLGRGGSDTTAVALAAALKANLCQIYTDVDGIYTSDPRIVPNAKLIPSISYDEVLELASLGAKILHPRSIELADKYKVPLEVRSSFHHHKGTTIKEDAKMEKVFIRGISLDENIGKISVLEVPDKPGIAFQLFSSLASLDIHVDMIVQNVNRNGVNDISFTVSMDELQEAIEVAQKFAFKVNANKVIYDKAVAKLSVVGTGVLDNAEIASNFFESLFELGINIQMISTSEIKISCIIDKEKGKEALKYMYQKFNI
ncbi:aspartate kinase [Garciella nitratireducens]|uniref:Aspartokinase n=1 Tax=Garciella nitratireducens DSM 15102 TaxID=1121911 RepID=A0A1T4L4S0_9FIRM|nr:aspartate kinase [Garciella nitratireducens]SJZ49719.1 aspartate kinase [Garciella nitratireducens DSM 15102]